ncbi:penicillin acylase family protein [Novosphingobium sp. KA1]|uniref:penicillin acylase family protein n=1 Tax=Novosphingobium sp. (strain KA1) TaxID=164608 RepID=UPI001A90AA61|nr:penicillin acylase family protein [Novosphingobium sp. KA1]QSR20129.1 penicillin acylase family protein [Novosphingobium sp. KA1]
MMQRRALLMASAALVALSSIGLARAAPQVRGTRRKAVLAGARAPIDIREDRMGIAHVQARSRHDAFFAQGYLVARDRLFQLDFDNRRELGRLAEVFGPKFAEADRAARHFHYRGDLSAELAALPAEVVDCARGYVAGINARIAETEAEPALLPAEYAITGMRPLRWSIEDMLRTRGAGAGDADDEVRRAMLQARGQLDLDHYMDPLRPAWSFTVPEGLDCAAVSVADLGFLRNVGKPLPFEQAELARWDRDVSRNDHAAQGSNAWTIAGSRSATGRPILANDPHLAIGGASPRHMIHLSAPGLDVIGAGYPGLPGIMQGHTDRFAFGRTNFHIDQTDLFVLRTRPEDPEQYWHEGKWKRFETYEETIAVKGEPAQRVTLRYAAGRPVVAQDPQHGRAIALATTAMLPGANMQFAIIALNLATDWDSLREAARLHVSPTNLHYADIEGNTGWQAIGFTPRRPRHDGLFPAPGDGSFDWTGILPVEDMPSLYNPEQGWIASANAMNLPADYPYRERIISFSWSDPFRHDRIAEVLRAPGPHSIEESVALQHDVQSLPARALRKLLPPRPSPAAVPAAALLQGWDGRIGAESGAALLYELVVPELSDRFRKAVIPADARDLLTSVNLSEMLHALALPDPRLGADPAAARDALVDAALAAGWAKAEQLAGSDPAQWRWGDLHRVTLRHPLADIPAIAAAYPPISGGRSGGDGTTVMARGFNAKQGYTVRHGASYLMVADVGDWDNTRFLLLPGQSADPASPHYRDFYQPWLSGEMQKLPFSAEAVRAATISRLQIVPA